MTSRPAPTALLILATVAAAHAPADAQPARPATGGRLPPEIIDRIIRQHLPRTNVCFEPARSANRVLLGRVTVRFVIGRDGTVSNVGNGGFELSDTRAVACVIRSFTFLRFPQPEGGIVTVNYTIRYPLGS